MTDATEEIQSIPDPLRYRSTAYRYDAAGWWLVLGDCHIPFHDKPTLELAVAEAERRNVKGVLLNGDILDYHQLSRFDKTPDDPRYVVEVQAGRQFFAYLRYKFPKAKLVYKEGNHEERLIKYITRNAEALFGLDVLKPQHFLHLDRHGIEYVTDKEVVHLGKLHVIHGHEYLPGIQAPVNPARGLFLRAKGNAMCNHFHQTSEHHEPTISGKPQGCWSLGCCCQLNPLYMKLNKWNLGFAFVEVGKQGGFSVDNKRVIEGEIV